MLPGGLAVEPLCVQAAEDVVVTGVVDLTGNVGHVEGLANKLVGGR